jgi:CYTH domain-containing protein
MENSGMPITRRFLIAPSLTRLIRKECGSERVIEGYFAPQSERQSRVRIETAQSCLILASTDVEAAEERTDLPRLHAEALLDVCPGKVTFERSALRLQGQEALVDRFVTPGPFDLVSVEFTDKAEAAAFLPPVWFGGEVTDDDNYSNNTLALSGLPTASETPLSGAALDAVLDALEGRPGRAASSGSGRKADSAAEAESTFDMLRRLAVVPPANSAAKMPEDEAGLAQNTTDKVTESRPRRPVLLAPADRDGDGDERLAGVIEGLSEALSQSPAETEERPDADLRGRPAWRWSAH